MRMWMVTPAHLCDKHLLGEHFELHMLCGTLSKGRVGVVSGLVRARKVEPQNIKTRHDALVHEMLRRGIRHHSPIEQPKETPHGDVDLIASYETLLKRCPVCCARQKEEKPRHVQLAP